MTVGAVCGLGAWALVQGTTGLIPGGSGMLFTPGWAPVTLVLVLLLTDPATIPRSPAGRALFGLICGAVMGLWGDVLIALGHPDFFGKVMAVPFTNALVPWIERWGRRLDERLSWLQPRLNRAHVAVWVVLGVLLLMVDGKGSHFSSNMHVHMSARPPLLKVGADGVPGCAENPIYCAPFSLGEELRCWGAKFGLGTQCADLEPFQAYAMAPYLRSHWSEQREGRRPIPP